MEYKKRLSLLFGIIFLTFVCLQFVSAQNNVTFEVNQALSGNQFPFVVNGTSGFDCSAINMTGLSFYCPSNSAYCNYELENSSTSKCIVWITDMNATTNSTISINNSYSSINNSNYSWVSAQLPYFLVLHAKEYSGNMTYNNPTSQNLKFVNATSSNWDTNGKIGTSYNFTGSDYIDINGVTGLQDPAGQFLNHSIEFWAKERSDNTGAFVGFVDLSAVRYKINSTSISSSSYPPMTWARPSIDVWHHYYFLSTFSFLACGDLGQTECEAVPEYCTWVGGGEGDYCDGGTNIFDNLTAYIDGEQVASSNTSGHFEVCLGGCYGYDGRFKVGANLDASEYFKGEIDEFRYVKNFNKEPAYYLNEYPYILRNYQMDLSTLELAGEEIETNTTTNVTDCQSLPKGNYTLLNDIDYSGAGGDCFTITGNEVNFDCQGFLIDNSGTGNRGFSADSGYTTLTIKNCEITDFTIGLALVGSLANGYFENISIKNVVEGVRMLSGFGTDGGIFKNITIDNANFYGLGLSSDADNNVFTNLNITNCNGDYGAIYMFSSVNNTFKDSYFTNNSYGIWYDDEYSYPNNPNYIYNNFFNNTQNVFVNFAYTYNFWNTTNISGTNIIGTEGIGGNYWSDYEGSSSDGDYFGNTPYVIDAGTGDQDNLPLLYSNSSNSPPNLTEIAITPNPAYKSDTLNCSAIYTDADSDLGDAIIYWFNGSTLYSSATKTGITSGSLFSDILTAGIQSKGEIWNCSINATDGTDISNEISTTRTISNTAPTVLQPTITPTPAFANDTLNCSSTYNDADGDFGDVQFEWYNDTILHSTTTLTGIASGQMVSFIAIPPEIQNNGEAWNCSVNASDGTDVSALVSRMIIINNTAPTIDALDLQPVSPTILDNLNCSFSITHPDQDPIVVNTTFYEVTTGDLLYISQQSGVFSGSVILESGNLTKGYTYICEIAVSDTSESITQNTTGRTVVNIAPTGVIQVNPATSGDNPECLFTPSDADDTILKVNITTTVNGNYFGSTEVNTTSGTQVSVQITPQNAGDNFTCYAFADDYDGGISPTYIGSTIITSAVVDLITPTASATLDKRSVNLQVSSNTNWNTTCSFLYYSSESQVWNTIGTNMTVGTNHTLDWQIPCSKANLKVQALCGVANDTNTDINVETYGEICCPDNDVNGICDVTRSMGTGMAIFVQDMAVVPELMLILALVLIVAVIGYAVARAINIWGSKV